jgi:hypothetical protein
MKRGKRNLNLEKETKRTPGKTSANNQGSQTKGAKSKKQTASTEQIQHPKEVGFHGTDDEKDLNPEE